MDAVKEVLTLTFLHMRIYKKKIVFITFLAHFPSCIGVTLFICVRRRSEASSGWRLLYFSNK